MMTINSIANGWLVSSGLYPNEERALYKATKEEVAAWVLANLKTRAQLDKEFEGYQTTLGSLPPVKKAKRAKLRAILKD